MDGYCTPLGKIMGLILSVLFDEQEKKSSLKDYNDHRTKRGVWHKYQCISMYTLDAHTYFTSSQIVGWTEEEQF